jgi:hypothetical protein
LHRQARRRRENSSRVRVCQNERAAVIDDARGLVFWFFRQVSRESPSAAAGKEINLEIATWKLANSLTSSGGVRGPVLARNKNKSSRKSSEKSPRRSKSKAAEDNNEVDLNVTHTHTRSRNNIIIDTKGKHNKSPVFEPIDQLHGFDSDGD